MRPTARCSKLYLAVGRTSGACSSAGGRRSSMRGWRWWILRTACSPCSWIGRAKAIPSCIMASCTTRRNCAPRCKTRATALPAIRIPRCCCTPSPSGGRAAWNAATAFLPLPSGRSGRARCFWRGTAAGSSRCFTCRQGTACCLAARSRPCWPTRPCRPGWTPTAWPKCCCLVLAAHRGAGCSKISGSCCPASAPCMRLTPAA